MYDPNNTTIWIGDDKIEGYNTENVLPETVLPVVDINPNKITATKNNTFILEGEEYVVELNNTRNVREAIVNSLIGEIL